MAEDNEINREVALELLHSVGIMADTAVNGREAIAMAQANHYDLILMDVQMPEMGGIDAARAILSMDGRRDVPILAMTANVFEEDRRSCEQAGMKDFIAKPVDPQSFFSMLLKWLPRMARLPGASRANPHPAHATTAEPPRGRCPIFRASTPRPGLPMPWAGFVSTRTCSCGSAMNTQQCSSKNSRHPATVAIGPRPYARPIR